MKLLRNKYFIISLAVIILIAGFFLFRDLSRPQVLVLINDDGFQPATLTVTQGTEVIFKNIGKQPHWPASDIHPTHGIYPEFDPQQEILPNSEWTFKFKKVGKWRFHDHLYPDHLGIITVTK